MRRTIWLAAAISIVLSAAIITGERLPVRTLTTADGLPRDQLACVVSDERGFVWFCTGEGLVRWDGHLAHTFGRDDGLSPAGVRTFLKTGNGQYWVGGDTGLFGFDAQAPAGPQRFRAVHREDGGPTGGINALLESRDHTVWCGAGRGLYRVTQNAGKVHVTEIDIGLPNVSENDRIVRAVIEDEQGSLWIGTASGLYRRRTDGGVIRVTRAEGLPVDEVRGLALDTAGRLWAGTRAGLALIDRAAIDANRGRVVQRVFTADDGLPATNIYKFHVTRDALWIGTVNGIAETTLEAGAFVVKRTVVGFYTRDIAGDLHGDIWIATESGARRLTDRGFTTFTTGDGLVAARVSSLFETRDGDVCATTLVGRWALSCFDGRQFSRVDVPTAQSIDDPGWGWSQLTLQDRRGRWWIPTGERLLQFAPGPPSSLARAAPSAVYDVRHGLRSSSIFRLFEDSTGAIWIATFALDSFGVSRIDATTGSVRTFGPADGLPDPLLPVHAFAEDRAGNIWLGLEESLLLRYRAGRFESVDTLNPAPKPTERTYDHLRSLLVDQRGRLWIASTASGLGRIDDPMAAHPTVRWYGTHEGLASNTAWTIVEHPSGDIFVGTARGADRFAPSTDRVAHYAAEDGVPRGEIWGALRDRSGHIWFATTDGAARLAAVDRPPEVRPLTLLTAIRIGGNPRPIPADGTVHVDPVNVDPGSRRIEIDFVSPGARSADGLRYQHQLKGIDAVWTTTSSRTVTLAGAAPGRYEFLVRSVLASGEAGDAASVEFLVLAPVWRRGWFIASISLIVGALALALHRVRVKRILEVERVRSSIAADLHDGVGASLSRIAILSEVVRQRAESALPEAIPALVSIADSARGVIDDMSDAVWSIDPRLDTLNHLLFRVRATASELFDDQPIVWTVDTPPDAAGVTLTPEQRRHLYLIVKESLTNVLRHAQATQVTVRIPIAPGRIRVEISDDGRGLGNASRSTAGSRRGIDNMRARATALGGTLTAEAGDGGRGTRVVVELPRGSSSLSL